MPVGMIHARISCVGCVEMRQTSLILIIKPATSSPRMYSRYSGRATPRETGGPRYAPHAARVWDRPAVNVHRRSGCGERRARRDLVLRTYSAVCMRLHGRRHGSFYRVEIRASAPAATAAPGLNATLLEMTNMFLKNSWYVAAWSHELIDDTLLGRTLLNEKVLLFRGRDDKVVAIEDRCCHRGAALSMGRLEG